MAGSRFHKIKQRRAERAPLTAHGGLNLVPLVDILTSIVFFSLATYTGAALAALTAFDLSLPPTVVSQPPAAGTPQPTLRLLLAVKVSSNGFRVEHAGNNVPFVQEIRGTGANALEQLRATLTQVRQSFPENKDVLVVPDDDVNYDNVIKVLEQARSANFTSISLGNRARSTQVAAASPVSNRGGR
ncbi:MAG TPA: biopolymer transporter ExbD [Gemmatimonadaceae bacterium]|nr:biopolymer transporter ExbD [Gemmatimonadaceae bacterium]